MSHSEEFSQNMDHWRNKWQLTPVLLPQEPHEQYEKAKKKKQTRRWVPQGQKVSNILLEKSRGQLLIEIILIMFSADKDGGFLYSQ